MIRKSRALFFILFCIQLIICLFIFADNTENGDIFTTIDFLFAYNLGSVVLLPMAVLVCYKTVSFYNTSCFFTRFGSARRYYLFLNKKICLSALLFVLGFGFSALIGMICMIGIDGMAVLYLANRLVLLFLGCVFVGVLIQIACAIFKSWITAVLVVLALLALEFFSNAFFAPYPFSLVGMFIFNNELTLAELLQFLAVAVVIWLAGLYFSSSFVESVKGRQNEA